MTAVLQDTAELCPPKTKLPIPEPVSVSLFQILSLHMQWDLKMGSLLHLRWTQIPEAWFHVRYGEEDWPRTREEAVPVKSETDWAEAATAKGTGATGGWRGRKDPPWTFQGQRGPPFRALGACTVLASRTVRE